MTDFLRELVARIRSFLSKTSREEEFDEELQSLLEIAIEDKIDRGMSPAEARRQALIDLGGIAQTRELHRANRGLPRLDSLLQDIGYGIRKLRRDAGLAGFAILIVGLGIAAGCVVFSVFHAILLRPLPFTEPEQLVWISNGESANLSAQTTQVANLLEFREQSESFSAVAGYSPFYGVGDVRLIGSGQPVRLTGVPVTEGFFRVLGIRPQLGRLFTSEESLWGAPPAVLLSHGFWKRQFGADENVIGRTITLNNEPSTVVGVLPATFSFGGIFSPGRPADIFSPFPLSPETNRRGNTLALVGRLHSGMGVRDAQTEATVLGDRIQSGSEGESFRNGFNPTLRALRDRVSGRFRSALILVSGAVGFLMLLVCANLSNLLLARGSARNNEMAVRAALGAGRGRLIRQLLVESGTISFCGLALGLLLAVGATSLLAGLEGTGIPLLHEVRVDGPVAGFTALLALLVGLLFGVIPAIQLSSIPKGTLTAGDARSSDGPRAAWIRTSLVVCEITIACVLLTCAGLLARSLWRVLDVEMGFEAENVLALRIDPDDTYSTLAEKTSYFDLVLGAAQSVSGVESASLTDALPLGENFGWRLWQIRADGVVYEKGKRPLALVRIVGDEYLDTLKIEVKSGRGFTIGDDAQSAGVVLINEQLAETLWPGKDPIGKFAHVSGHPDRRVIGVVRGVRYFGLERDSEAEMYLPIRQTGDFSTVDLVVRTTRPAADVIPELRSALRLTDPELPVADFRLMSGLVNLAVFPRRSIVVIVAGFSTFGLILAALGIYSVIWYSVSRRQREIGIRLALGASTGKVALSILSQTGRLVAVGALAGVLGSWMGGRAIQGMLFEVPPSDPATLALVVGLLASSAMLAGYFPARKAARLNPLDALRRD